jgi:hypothetical protein
MRSQKEKILIVTFSPSEKRGTHFGVHRNIRKQVEGFQWGTG